MRYATLFSGIEACSVAWEPIGMEPVYFSELAKFPSAVLSHHYPNIPNLGDMTKYKEWKNAGTVDLVCAGSPCQAFSIGGFREGLRDPRGNLTLSFLGFLEFYRPRWVVWENVTGVLSDRTNAFGSFVAGLGQLGYGFAYRVLDAQYFGVAQQRKRVFVVAYLGDWRPASTVLFEAESLSRDTRKGGEVDKYNSESNQGSLEPCGEGTSYSPRQVSLTVTSKWKKSSGGYAGSETGNLVLTKLAGHCVYLPRRITPLECERLQGFPDNWTRVPWNRKNGAPETLRYEALGNSMAVPVMRWIGERIKEVDKLL
jgi:DNA (cytosine-5)-methyltransferase 1